MHCSSDISAAASRERRYHGQQRTSELENDFPGGPDGGSPAWIRTTIHGSKGRCPTIRRPGKLTCADRTSAPSVALRRNAPQRSKLHRRRIVLACRCLCLAARGGVRLAAGLFSHLLEILLHVLLQNLGHFVAADLAPSIGVRGARL